MYYFFNRSKATYTPPMLRIEEGVLSLSTIRIKERIRELVGIIYDEYSEVGGELHIVLDGGKTHTCDFSHGLVSLLC